MARYHDITHSRESLIQIDRLCQHHDHLKLLVHEYDLMRQIQTYARMVDGNFHFDEVAVERLDNSWFTGVIVKLDPNTAVSLFTPLQKAYQRLETPVKTHHPDAKVEIYFESAHITIKALWAGERQSEAMLWRYGEVIRPLIQKWLSPVSPLAQETILYGMGLFSSLHPAKGLSIGLRFYPNLPLIQILRGEIGAALYAVNPSLPLQPEGQFHTMLTHSTGFRARGLHTPFTAEFITEFRRILESYDRTVFGAIDQIEAKDIFVRSGFSDKLLLGEEICLG